MTDSLLSQDSPPQSPDCYCSQWSLPDGCAGCIGTHTDGLVYLKPSCKMVILGNLGCCNVLWPGIHSLNELKGWKCQVCEFMEQFCHRLEGCGLLCSCILKIRAKLFLIEEWPFPLQWGVKDFACWKLKGLTDFPHSNSKREAVNHCGASPSFSW